VRAQDGLAAQQRVAEHGQGRKQGAAHAGLLRALTAEQEDDARGLAGATSEGGRGAAGGASEVVPGDGLQGGLQGRGVIGDDGERVREAGAADARGVAAVAERELGAGLQIGGVTPGEGSQRGGGLGGEQEQLGAGLRGFRLRG
jgi:hypothetical protein